jgi:hypothetical protein
MQGDHVALRQKTVERIHRAGIAMGQLGRDVIIIDMHAKRRGEHRKLGADIAVPDNAELLLAHFIGAVSGFQPFAALDREHLFGNAPHQHDH